MMSTIVSKTEAAASPAASAADREPPVRNPSRARLPRRRVQPHTRRRLRAPDCMLELQRGTGRKRRRLHPVLSRAAARSSSEAHDPRSARGRGGRTRRRGTNGTRPTPRRARSSGEGRTRNSDIRGAGRGRRPCMQQRIVTQEHRIRDTLHDSHLRAREASRITRHALGCGAAEPRRPRTRCRRSAHNDPTSILRRGPHAPSSS